jgi:TrmH family RNA methyltransferase
VHLAHDLGFGAAIDVGDEVIAALARDLERVHPVEVPHDEIARGTRGGNGDVDQWVHDWNERGKEARLEYHAMSDALSPAELLAQVRIVLVSPRHPGNIGAAARAMKNMGLSEFVLVTPECALDEKERALAAHAVDLLERARIVDDLSLATSGCRWVVATSARPRHLGDEPMTPWDAASRMIERAAQGPVALVFGSERVGLTNEELEHCHATARIPVSEGYSSVNLAAAVQIFTYELRKAAIPRVAPVAVKRDHPNYAPPTAEDMARFYEHLELVLLKTGFLDPKNPGLLMRRLRQMFNRAQPDSNELAILRGILRTVETPKKRSSRLGGIADE